MRRRATTRIFWRFAARVNGISYSMLMNGLKKKSVGLDRRALSALAFAETPAPFQQLASRECRAFLASKNLARLIPIRLPHGTRYLLIPIATLALMHWEARIAADAREREKETAQKQVSPTANQLEQLAKAIEKTLDPAKDEELKKLAEQLKKSAGEHTGPKLPVATDVAVPCEIRLLHRAPEGGIRNVECGISNRAGRCHE